MRLVPRALIRGFVFGNKVNRALTGLLPTILFQASGLLPPEPLPGRSRRLPCVSCCAIVVMSSVAYLRIPCALETAVRLWTSLARLALPRAVQMYWAKMGTRIGLLYYCFLNAT